jgi:hypothetical protein
MYSTQYIRYLNFPPIPSSIIESINPTILLESFKQDVKEHKKNPSMYETYTWTDESNAELNAWCQDNICADMYYAFQIITGILPIHKDNGTKIKLNYIVIPGGANVITEFYNDDLTTKLASYSILANKWHVFKADTYHSVSNIDPDQIRLGITARIFE